MFYHMSLFSGRTDSIIVEASSHSKLFDFFTNFSTAIVRNIKAIRYSKDYNINYVNKDYIHEDVYKKVIVTAMSENHTKIYTLFDIKKTVTKEDIISNFKKLYIINEPIIDIAYVEFFDEGVLSPIDIKNLYQIQYKRNNKTKVEDIYAPSWETLKEVCDNIIGGELTEIREYKQADYSKKDFSLNTNRNVKIILKFGQNFINKFTIPKIKKSANITSSDIETTFLLNNQKPNNIEISY